MKTIVTRFCLAALLTINTVVFAQPISIVPEPVMIQAKTGVYVLSQKTAVIVPSHDAAVLKVADYLIEKIRPATGYQLQKTATGPNGIHLIINKTIDSKLGTEGYNLEVTTRMIEIKANTASGLFYAVQTLLQLMPPEIESSLPIHNINWKIPAVRIEDYPRFAWRGLMLDVSRHFFPKEYIKNYIDQMSRYKYNRFHWHLTDDNGWRIEIKSYPKLTEVGAWRVPRTGTFATHEAPRFGEAPTYGGFYTQEDIREVIQFAKERFIEILPEIDVPGHSMAALASYPELGVTKDTTLKVDPGTDFAKWFGEGNFEMTIENTLNPTDEKVYEFLDNVYAEIAHLFPFQYIHMGGDECYKGFWERDSVVCAFMKKHNLRNGVELQNYFSQRVSRIILSKNKTPIGWDEILEGGSAPEAVVMSWRGIKGGVQASREKHPVVMSPAPYFYLDMCQGEPSVEPPATYLEYNKARLLDAYDFDILSPEIDSSYVLGGQGNLWTEQVPSTRQVEYMTYPRAFALAESLWTSKSKKDRAWFLEKVECHLTRLDYANVNYATSMYDPIINVRKNQSGLLEVDFPTEAKELIVHYTFDNTLPDRYAPAYNLNVPVTIPDGADNLKVLTYRNGKPIGRLISLTMSDLAKRIQN
jgi:hexosaminidase